MVVFPKRTQDHKSTFHMDLRDYIAEIPDFPKQGILFRDICPLMRDPRAWETAINKFIPFCETQKPDVIAGIEARGFIIGSALSIVSGIGFVPVRKKGKLPGLTFGMDYELEYGSDRLEIQRNILTENSRVLIIDDLLATGGTAKACGDLIEHIDCQVIGYGFVVELSELEGRQKLTKQVPIKSLITY